MQPKKFLPAIFLLTIVIAAVNHAIIANSFQSWFEPLVLVVHIIIVFLLYVFLQMRVGVRASIVGALLFALFPGHAYVFASGIANVGTVAIYVITWFIAAYLAIGYERFYKFLKTQEPLVRHLFLVGVYVLIASMVLMTLQINLIWQNSQSLWKYRVEHYQTPEALNKWAKILYQMQGKKDEAKAIYQRAIEVYPKYIESYLDLCEIYYNESKSENLVRLSNQLLAAVPEDPDVYLRLMEIYHKAIARFPDAKIYQEKREEMLAQYEQISKRKNYSANDYYNLGFLYEQVGGFEQAMRYYRKALELDPKHEKSLFNVANRLQQVGDYKNAIIVYERIIKLYPRTTSAYLNLGIIANALGDVNKARIMYEQVIKIDSNNAQAYFNLGYLNETAGELREALNDYEKAVEINPKHGEAYYNMGNVYATLGQNAEAIASYLKTIAINPNHLNAFVNLSILSFKAKDFKGAIHYLEEAQLLGYTPPEGFAKALEPYKRK